LVKHLTISKNFQKFFVFSHFRSSATHLRAIYIQRTFNKIIFLIFVLCLVPNVCNKVIFFVGKEPVKCCGLGFYKEKAL